MKFFCGFLFSLMLASTTWSQVEIGLNSSRNSFLLYEPVVVTVTFRNTTEHDLVLRSENQRPWLSFLMIRVSDEIPVHQDQAADFQGITLKPDETKGLTVNLTPFYAFRETGKFKVR